MTAKEAIKISSRNSVLNYILQEIRKQAIRGHTEYQGFFVDLITKPALLLLIDELHRRGFRTEIIKNMYDRANMLKVTWKSRRFIYATDSKVLFSTHKGFWDRIKDFFQ